MCDAEKKKSSQNLAVNSADFALNLSRKVGTFHRYIKSKRNLNFHAIFKRIFLFLLLLNDTNLTRAPTVVLLTKPRVQVR